MPTNTNLLNHSKVRTFTLSFAGSERAHKFTRVSASFINECEAELKAMICRKILKHPSMGKTIQSQGTDTL